VSELLRLATGAEARLTNGRHERMVVCANGGQARELAGTWSTSLQWLVERLAPSFPELGFVELRYRIKSWRRLELCVEDARAALAAAGGARRLLVGFSMGGAVSISAADEPGVVGVLGLAPWIPEKLDLSPLLGRRLDVLHGSLDRGLPGIPGVSSTSSRRGFERARALGIDGSYAVVRGGVHGLAVRVPGGSVLPLPRAAAWAQLVAAQLATFAA
jgi:dienelactone hydrolase